MPTLLQVPAANAGVQVLLAPAPASVIVDRPVPFVYATNVTATCVPEGPVQVRSTTVAAAAGGGASDAIATRAATAAATPAGGGARRRHRPGRPSPPIAGGVAGPVDCCMRYLVSCVTAPGLGPRDG